VAAPTLFCRQIGVSDMTRAVKYWERIAASDIHYLQEPESAAYLFFPSYAIQLIVWYNLL
jgi:hypothetical protein